MKNIKTSPIFYQGCKKKLIKKGLIGMFPKDINTFFDVFGGSGIVSMNTKAKKYVINDIDKNLVELYKMFKLNEYEHIVSVVLGNVKEFNLRRVSIKNDDENMDKHKLNYYLLRNKANTTNEIIDLYTTMFYSFSQQMRFNSKGAFNMPCGNRAFTKNNEFFIKQGCDFFSKSNLRICNCQFDSIPMLKFKTNDFVYLDPPYLDTTATYNENGGWIKADEDKMYNLLEELNSKGIKWGMSNSFRCKCKDNKLLKEWCIKNNWNVKHFDVKYSAMGKGNSNNDEVYIYNYNTESTQLEMELD